MVAEELYRLMRKDIRAHIAAVVDSETDEFIGHKEAARMLGMTPGSLYHRDDVPYTLVGRKRLYSKAALRRYVRKD